ncbi:glycine zipper domain-containing protein [Alicyclobacillus pomorum]|jgi:outer membrane lipoprotein SlyB|uniref:glycine zipper domain-containing protein n=1 Tax=Alicyclobacillus pomorum TaxID=204470 RepID=UPI00040EBEC7|nr:glycine zipper domain-containing protein [Alicyclobacillus pomorum]
MFEQVWRNMFEGGSLWAGVINGGFAQLQDTIALTNGKIKAEDYAANSTKNVSMAIGTMAGVECGALVGTAVMPGFGTMIGSIVGGYVGDRLGTYAGQQVGNIAFKGSNPGGGTSPSVSVSQ